MHRYRFLIDISNLANLFIIWSIDQWACFKELACLTAVLIFF